MGLTVYIRRSPLGDSTAGGVSSRVTRLTLVNVEGPFEPSEDAPAAILDSHFAGIARIVPVEPRRLNGTGPMLGGNFAATSDSRFTAAVESLTGVRFYGAIAIHDRFECQS